LIKHTPYQLVIAFFLILPAAFVHAQNSSGLKLSRDTILHHPIHLFSGSDQIDIVDIGRNILRKHAGIRTETVVRKPGKLYGSVLPAAEFTLQTGFAADLVSNLAFYTGSNPKQNISNFYLNLTYTAKNQLLIPLQGDFWTRGNQYNLLTDWRFEKFPQNTYGLGPLTTESDGYLIDFFYLRFYQTVYKKFFKDLYLGLGFDADHFYQVREVNPPPGRITDFQRNGLHPTANAIGPTIDILYDQRRNSIDPVQGHYASIVYRTNSRFLGSDSNWQSLQIDMREYDHFPAGSKNILAFWTFDWFTLMGHPPYLMLPSTASDTYANMGRGYIQGRFRGRNMLYAESEYRFGVTSNGLIGGVVFVNAQSFTEPSTNRFEAINPGWGAGIRIKINKFSHTNAALDYGFGLHGSKGIFANLGEVF
jgi:hypothetical protein